MRPRDYIHHCEFKYRWIRFNPNMDNPSFRVNSKSYGSHISHVLICPLDLKFAQFQRILLVITFSNYAGGTDALATLTSLSTQPSTPEANSSLKQYTQDSQRTVLTQQIVPTMQMKLQSQFSKCHSSVFHPSVLSDTRVMGKNRLHPAKILQVRKKGTPPENQ